MRVLTVKAVLLFTALLFVVPLCIVLVVSVSGPIGLSRSFFSFLSDFKTENYIDAWTRGRMGLYSLNTMMVMAATLASAICMTSMSAYGIKRYKYREVGFVYYFLISGMFIPVQIVVFPLFKVLKAYNLVNSLAGLCLVYIGTSIPISIMMFTGFFKSIPHELEEAAVVDGCGPMKAFWLVIFPLSKTVSASVAILVGLTIWKDFFIPLVLITEPAKKTLAVGLLSFVDQYMVNYGPLCASMVIQSIPIIGIFLFLQKYFVSGVVAGSVKG